MNKITVIQLLNKIANGEEVPKEIAYTPMDGCRYILEYDVFKKDYYDGEYYLMGDVYDIIHHLTDELEIIEEPKEKEGFVTNGHGFVPNKDGVSIFPVEKYDFAKHFRSDEDIEEDKEIKYLECDYILPVRPAKENEAYISSCLMAHEQKINELIKAINELKKGK